MTINSYVQQDITNITLIPLLMEALFLFTWHMRMEPHVRPRYNITIRSTLEIKCNINTTYYNFQVVLYVYNV